MMRTGYWLCSVVSLLVLALGVDCRVAAEKEDDVKVDDVALVNEVVDMKIGLYNTPDILFRISFDN